MAVPSAAFSPRSPSRSQRTSPAARILQSPLATNETGAVPSLVAPTRVSPNFSITQYWKETSPFPRSALRVQEGDARMPNGNAGILYTTVEGHDSENNTNMLLNWSPTRRHVQYVGPSNDVDQDFRDTVLHKAENLEIKLECTQHEINDLRVDWNLGFSTICSRLRVIETSLARLVTRENLSEGLTIPKLRDIKAADTMCELRALNDLFIRFPNVSIYLVILL